MGEILWRESPVDADLVISVPDSGNPAANGFARASGIPQDDGLIKNRYVARTFIQPGQELRKHGLRMKFNPLPEIVAGKRVVVVDDSIVRGNTTRQIVGMLKDAGAKEVHLRISSPPIRHPCHYGIDMSTREEMIAHDRTVEQIADELGADSLAYLSMEGVYEAIGAPAERHCDACFTGNYPLGDGGEGNGKFALEELTDRRRSLTATRTEWPSGSPFSPPARGPTCRRSSTGCTVGTGSRSPASPRTSPTRGRWSARVRRGSRRGVFERSAHPDRASRDAAIADWLDEPGRRPDRARRLHGAPVGGVREPVLATGSSTSTRRCFRRSRASTRSARRSRTGCGSPG